MNIILLLLVIGLGVTLGIALSKNLSFKLENEDLIKENNELRLKNEIFRSETDNYRDLYKESKLRQASLQSTINFIRGESND